MDKITREYRSIPANKIDKVEALYKLFKEELDIDIINRSRHIELIEHRSLFNTILRRKYKISLSCIAGYYRSKGWDKMTHATVLHSTNKFKKYAKKEPDLLDTYFELHPAAKRKRDYDIHTKYIYKQSLKPIQKLVSDLTEEQEKELIELITLRKKSWLWKSKDKITVYEGS
jgi:hypothetical protein